MVWLELLVLQVNLMLPLLAPLLLLLLLLLLPELPELLLAVHAEHLLRLLLLLQGQALRRRGYLGVTQPLAVRLAVR